MKRLLLLIFTLMLCNFNFAFAKNYDISQISQAKLVTEYSEDTTVDYMDTVTFGSYYQSNSSTKEPIEWIVLDRQGNKTLLLSKYILDCKCYNDVDKDITWENCTLRYWLNNTFYNTAFSSSEKSYIDNTYVINNDNTLYHTSGGNNTYDNVFLLSIDEANKIFYQFKFEQSVLSIDNKRLATKGTNYAKDVANLYQYLRDYWYKGNSRFLLRSPGSEQNAAAVVSVNGELLNACGNSVAENGSGVRPALWVDYSSISIHNTSRNDITSNNKSNIGVGTITGMPSRQAEWRSDSHFYLDDSMQRNKWVYYVTDYYHVDANGDIEKNKWIDQRYVGADGKLYRGRQTPDGQYVGDNGLIVNVAQDLYNSVMTKTADPDSWYQTQSGLWYYFENDRTTTKKGWFKDYRDDQWYYFDLTTGIMLVGWQKIDGKDYYFNEFHTGNNWYEVGGGFFESYGKKVKAYGSMFKSEKTPDGYWVNWNGEYIKNGNFFLAINPIIYVWFILVILLIIIVVYYLRKKNVKINDIIVVVINKFNLLIKNKPKKSK